MTPPLIYNLFPRLIGTLSRWPEHARRAAAMRFNWIFLNPWHYPGFSGSLYAPKEYDRLNPLFLPAGTDEGSLEPLREFVGAAGDLGLRVMMDLVVNHTAKDSPLTREHPAWYRWDHDGELISPRAVDPDDPSRVTVWGDLAEVDNAGSPDRVGLWNFWGGLIDRALDLGFAGFRCDAAYMVPAELWRFLIDRAKTRRDDVLFFAETLGSSEERVLALSEAGFDYFFNSSKWWNYRDAWALEQHHTFGRIAPSISFPETHDTARLAEETGGDEAVQRQRYAFAAAFSAGLMIPVGYEFGFRKPLDVVRTMPSDWERRAFDLRPFIGAVNRLKCEQPLLQQEGELRSLLSPDESLVVLERRVPGVDGAAYVIVNKDDVHGASTELGHLGLKPAGLALHRVCREEAAVPAGGALALDRAEVVYLLPYSDPTFAAEASRTA